MLMFPLGGGGGGDNLEVNYSTNVASPEDGKREGEMFLEAMPCRKSYSKDYKRKQEEQHSYDIGIWNIRTVNETSSRCV